MLCSWNNKHAPLILQMKEKLNPNLSFITDSTGSEILMSPTAPH